MPGIGKTRIFHSLKDVAVGVLKQETKTDYHPIEIFITFQNGTNVCEFDKSKMSKFSTTSQGSELKSELTKSVKSDLFIENKL
jgi:hypothetical protein